MQKNIKKIIASISIMFVVLSVMLIKIESEHGIECKIIYEYYQAIGQECILHLERDGVTYKVAPHFPLEDTYEGGWLETSYTIPKELTNIDEFRLELLSQDNISEISSLEFYNHGVQIAKYSSSDINKLFEFGGLQTETDFGSIKISGDAEQELIISGNDTFISEYNHYSDRNWSMYGNCLFFSVISGILVWLVMSKYEAKKNIFTTLSIGDYILAGLLVAIFVLACVMSVFSKIYSHPDETVTRFAIDYYLGGWIHPDVDSSWTAGTYSLHRGLRLSESTLYYFFAGKIGWLFREYFHLKTYFRMFGLILLAIMLIACWKFRKQYRWMPLTLLLTPQLWYIFSYATSDAWDWFWGFWMLVLIMDKKSMLYKCFDKNQSVKRRILYTICSSMIFALILQAKTNYLILLGVAFTELLCELISRKDERKHLIMMYVLILVSTFAIKIGIDNIPHVSEENAFTDEGYDIIQAAQEERDALSVDFHDYHEPSPKESGASMMDVLGNYSGYMPTLPLLFTSGIGNYMWMTLLSGKTYTCIMALLYAAIAINLFVHILRKKNGIMYLKQIMASGIAFAAICITLLYCWVVTFMPQGRYLLTLFLILGYMYGQYDDLLETKRTKLLITLSCICGLWSFAYAGIYTMWQLGYMLVVL